MKNKAKKNLSPGLNAFDLRVLKEITKIPFGQVRTYKWVAKKIGSPKSSRAVGNSLKKNPYPLVIPCHRVIKSNGGLGGYSLGMQVKKDLIGLEKRLKNIFCLIREKEV